MGDGMSELVSHIDYGKFFDEILQLDKNIRFAAIYDGQFHAKFIIGIQWYLEEEEIKSSLSRSQRRWDSRKKLSYKIGEPRFAMAQYGKVNRITIPLENDGLILITTELDVDIIQLVDKVIEIRAGFF